MTRERTANLCSAKWKACFGQLFGDALKLVQSPGQGESLRPTPPGCFLPLPMRVFGRLLGNRFVRKMRTYNFPPRFT